MDNEIYLSLAKISKKSPVVFCLFEQLTLKILLRIFSHTFLQVEINQEVVVWVKKDLSSSSEWSFWLWFSGCFTAGQSKSTKFCNYNKNWVHVVLFWRKVGSDPDRYRFDFFRALDMAWRSIHLLGQIHQARLFQSLIEWKYTKGKIHQIWLLFQSNINGLRMCDNCNDFQQLLYNVERQHEATIAGGKTWKSCRSSFLCWIVQIFLAILKSLLCKSLLDEWELWHRWLFATCLRSQMPTLRMFDIGRKS